jgi:hypothetical protein
MANKHDEKYFAELLNFRKDEMIFQDTSEKNGESESEE